MNSESNVGISVDTNGKPWGQVVSLLAALLLAVLIWAKLYEGEVWEPAVEVFPEWEIEEEEKPTLLGEFTVSCQANTIISSGYQACKEHPVCGLSNDEMLAMYIAGKTAVIDCKKAEVLDAFIEYNNQIQEMEDIDIDKWLDPDEPEKPETNEQLRISL